jgi:hypothetical protein
MRYFIFLLGLSMEIAGAYTMFNLRAYIRVDSVPLLAAASILNSFMLVGGLWFFVAALPEPEIWISQIFPTIKKKLSVFKIKPKVLDPGSAYRITILEDRLSRLEDALYKLSAQEVENKVYAESLINSLKWGFVDEKKAKQEEQSVKEQATK